MHLAKGDLGGWWYRVWSQWHISDHESEAVSADVFNEDIRFAILYTAGTDPIAQKIAIRLRAHGWSVSTLLDNIPVFDHDWYFVLNSAAITLPPTGKRWCYLIGDGDIATTERHILQRSAAILAATIDQLEHLAALGLVYPQVHYLPMSDEACEHDFDFMLDRFLVAQQLLPIRILLSSDLPIASSKSAIVLSMPETIERHKAAKNTLPSGCQWFCGVRRKPGWVGCGLSYQALAQHALKHRMRHLLVIEDDAVVPDMFENVMCDVQEFLDAHEGEWDVFCGMIADLDPDTTVQSVCTYNGMTMVWVDRMTSMVCNVYAFSALQRLTEWSPEKKAGVANTIDRYLGQAGQLRVVVALPFLVGHREDAESTLWGASNRLYSASIQSAERGLMRKVADYQRKLN